MEGWWQIGPFRWRCGWTILILEWGCSKWIFWRAALFWTGLVLSSASWIEWWLIILSLQYTHIHTHTQIFPFFSPRSTCSVVLFIRNFDKYHFEVLCLFFTVSLIDSNWSTENDTPLSPDVKIQPWSGKKSVHEEKQLNCRESFSVFLKTLPPANCSHYQLPEFPKIMYGYGWGTGRDGYILHSHLFYFLNFQV